MQPCCNDELTASDFKMLLVREFGEEKPTYSERTIARARNELGWTFTTARYCQAIRDANKLKWVVWVNKCLEGQEKFKDIIFTDECTVQLEFHSRPAREMPQESWNTTTNILWNILWTFMCERGFPREERQYSVELWQQPSTRDILCLPCSLPVKDIYPNGHRLFQD